MLVECSHCRITLEVGVLFEYENHNQYDPMDGEKYSFLRCPKCLNPILTRATYVFEFNNVEWGNPVVIFPTNKFHVNPSIPKDLRTALLESIQCYEASLYTPTVIMCRRTLQGFCEIMGIDKKIPLARALAQLQANRVINDQLFEWANLLKDTGNEAAHNITSSFTHMDAKDLLDFTIAILDFSYSFKDKYDSFIKRQKGGEHEL